MTNQQRTPFPIDGIDSGDIAAFLVDALAVMRRHNDLADVCVLLTTRLGAILPVVGAAVLLADGSHLPVVASATGNSTTSRRLLEDLVDSDPVHRCLATGEPVSGHDPSRDGSLTLHALPIGAHDTLLGALLLVSDGPLTDQHVDVAGIFVDVAAVAFLQAGPHLASASSRARFTDLVRSLDTIEQAKGMLGQRHGIGVDAAFDGLWSVALDHAVALGTLARHVVNRTLDDVLNEALVACFTNRASAPAE